MRQPSTKDLKISGPSLTTWEDPLTGSLHIRTMGGASRVVTTLDVLEIPQGYEQWLLLGLGIPQHLMQNSYGHTATQMESLGRHLDRIA